MASLFLAFVIALPAFAESDLALSGRVVDNANLLSASEFQELEKFLAEYEARTSNQVVVVTLRTLEGKNIEEFGYELGRRWGIGTKEKNNGVLLIVAPNEREVRIEVGYGLEGILTDAQSKIIIERNILPYFRRGELGQGIIQGAHAIISTLGGEARPVENNNEDKISNYILFFIILAFFFMFFIRSNFPRGPRTPRSGGPFGLGNGRSSGGGFGGGGGSFGGGGASGKW